MHKYKKFLAPLICLVLLFAATPFAGAQQAPSGSGLSISPTISEYTIKPGDSASVTITLKNITVDNVTAQGFVNDFTADNYTGNPKIITNSNTPTQNSIRNFVYGLD